MDQVNSMRIFVRVAQRASFAESARELRMSPAAVTKHVAALEARLGARLLDRTTRRVALTEIGRVYLERCLECLHAFEDADACARELAKSPRGKVRVTAPVDLHRTAMAAIAPFLLAHPDVEVDLQLSNRSVDLVEEGLDVAIRAAPALDGAFVARPLALIHMMMWAAPAYVQRHGAPRRPQDLAAHRMLVFASPRPMTEIMFTRGVKPVRVTLDPIMTANHGESLLSAVEAGAGIAMLPSFLAHDAAAAGRIEPVLVAWRLPTWRLYALYPHRRFFAPAVRAFVEALRAAHGDASTDPWWPLRDRR